MSASRHLVALSGLVAWSIYLMVPAQSQTERYQYGPHMMWGWGWSGMIFGPIMMIIVLGAGVATVVLVLRWLGRPGMTLSDHSSGGTPIEILKERFARGEIDKDEFEERRRALGD